MRTFAAIGLLLCGVALLTVMGALIKILGARYAATELSAWRNLFGLIPTILMLRLSADWKARGRPLRLRAWKLALARGGFVTVAQLCYYAALARLEFATAATLTFTGPLFVTALSVLVLRDRVGWWRIGAVTAGFVGAALIMRPGADAFDPAALLPLAAALGYASAAVAAPLVDEEAPTALVNLYGSGAALVGATALAFALGDPTGPRSAADLALILAMGGAGGCGVLCLVGAYRLTRPSIISPFEYFGVLYAALLGWALFGEAPWASLWPGAPLVVAAGLVVAWRERRREAR